MRIDTRGGRRQGCGIAPQPLPVRLDFAKALVPAMTGRGKQQIDLSKEWFDLLHVHELALGRFAAVFSARANNCWIG
jgi:hypothetical protein